jgi:hypothetical protein
MAVIQAVNVVLPLLINTITGILQRLTIGLYIVFTYELAACPHNIPHTTHNDIDLEVIIDSRLNFCDQIA